MSFSYSKGHKDNYKNLPPETVLGWIEEVTGVEMKDKKDMKGNLANGRTLCALINKIKPGTIKKIHKSNLGFMKLENISFFIRAAKSFGVPDTDMMSAVDLYDGTNIEQVCVCLESLSRVSRKMGFGGPFIGVKLAKKNVRAKPAKRGEGIAENMWETRMKKQYKKAKVVERQKHGNIRNPEEERKLYSKNYHEDND